MIFYRWLQTSIYRHKLWGRTAGRERRRSYHNVTSYSGKSLNTAVVSLWKETVERYKCTVDIISHSVFWGLLLSSSRAPHLLWQYSKGTSGRTRRTVFWLLTTTLGNLFWRSWAAASRSRKPGEVRSEETLRQFDLSGSVRLTRLFWEAAVK